MFLQFLKRISILFLLIGLFSCGSNSKKETKNSTQQRVQSVLPVEAYVITPEVLKSSIQIAGTLIPLEETEIHPEVAGKVIMLSVKEGGYVSKGTLLARLFDGDLRAQLQKLKVQIEVANKTQDRQSELLKIGGISQQDYDLSALNVNSLQADIAILQTQINKTYIRAPFNGKLGFKNISTGAYVTPQTVVTTIRQIDELKLEFSVPEKYTNQIRAGNKVNFTTETFPGVHEATIVSTESSISADNRSLMVHAIFRNNKNNIRAGSFANITFDLGENAKAVMIPAQCIIPEARDKKVIVYKNGKADFTVVTTGIRESSKVEILSGLSIGDTVITTGLLSLKPDSPVTISSFKNETE